MMKKLFCIAFVLLGALSSATAQHYIGAKGGYGAAYGRVYSIWGTAESSMLWNKPTFGVVWKYFSSQQVVGGFSAELEYQARGYRIYDQGVLSSPPVISDTTTYRAKTRTVSSITMPLIWQPHLYMMNRKVRVFVSAGITLSYNLGMGDTWTATDYKATKERVEVAPGVFEQRWVQTVTSETMPYEMQTARDVRWNYGWLGGLGFGVLLGRWEVFAEGRYYYGMSDILRTRTKYQFNEERSIRSELDNIYITMGVTFRLGKGGITEPPLRRRRAIPASENDFRNIKLTF